MAMDLISVQASSVAYESAFSTSGRVLSIQRTRLTLASLEMCKCLKDHLDAKERKQDKCPLKTPLDFEEDVFNDEVQRNEAIPLSDEEIALDANGSSEGTMSPGGPRYDYMMSRPISPHGNNGLDFTVGVNILKSIDEGPYKMGTVRETLAESTEGAPQFGPERSRVYSDLTSKEKDRYNDDIRATNILLQGLPKDIYTLINHYTDAKDIWDNFAKLINDMRNIKMTMSKLQLNSKFVNNMLPEWGRYVTAMKLNRGLRDSNYDQLYAYLKQHETHAKENKMMLERFSQPTGRPNRGQGMNLRGGNAAGYRGAQNRVRNVNQGQARPGQERTVKCYNCNGGQDNAFNDDVDKQPAQDLALNVDNVFQADDCDSFDSDVDEAPTAQTMFMANLSSVDPVTDEARLSYNSDILSEV
nr:zinc finger BED domain-containing protein RICESLEEPER 2 [Tanacetum cinerariifolium]